MRITTSIRTLPAPAVTAVVASALGLLAMAVMGASPGSPYQPRLTPNGRPVGALRGVAEAVGLDALHGNVLLVVSVAITCAALAGFALMLREAFRGNVSVAAVAVLVVAAHLLLFFVPLLFSRDVYSYAFYGRIAGIYGSNPYVSTPLDHSGDLLWNFVGPRWIDTPAVYGPAWTTASAVLSRFLPRPVDHVEAYTFIAIAASLAVCAAIVGVVRELWPARTAFALAAFGANPVVVFHSVGSAHNDLLVAFGIIAGLGLVLHRRSHLAVVVLTLAALVKATAVVPLVLLLVWLIARTPPERRRRAAMTHVGLAAALTLAFAAPYLQGSDPTLGMLELASHEGWIAPAATASKIVDFLTFGALGWAARAAFGGVFLVAFWRLAREVWRRGAELGPRGLAASWGWALVLFTLLGPVLLPWYIVWSLPLAWVLPRLPRSTVIGIGVVAAATVWSTEAMRFPGAFQVNALVGTWLIAPALLVVFVKLARDLRRRIDGGLALDDEPGPDVIVVADAEPDHERGVAAPTG